MTGPLRRLAAPLLFTLLLALPASAAEYGRQLATLVVSYGDAICDQRSQATCYDDATHLVRDATGRLNLAESSLNYAAALLMADGDAARAREVIAAVLAHQDRAEGSPTLGLFRWYPNEASAFDPAATWYLAPTLAWLAGSVEDAPVRTALAESARLALRGLLQAPNRPREGFALAMWSGAVCALGAAVGDATAQQAGGAAVIDMVAKLRTRGPAGVPSPTFDALRLGGLRWAWQYAPDEAARAAAQTALRVHYADLLQRYDPRTALVLGPIGQSYATDYLGSTGVARYLLACDLPSALAATREAGPLAMYFALSDYALPRGLLSLAEDARPASEVRSRTPDSAREAPESASTCTWVAPGMSLGTMSGTVEPASIPVLATCDLPERPTSYFYALGAPATVQSVQSGPLALCSFNFDGAGVGTRMHVAVRGVLGRRDQIDRVIVGRHEWIGEPEAVGQNGVVALQRGSCFLGIKILEVGFGKTARREVKPGVIEWYAEGNMDSLLLTIYGRQEGYPLPQPLYDVRVGLLVELAPAAQFGSLEEFVEHVGRRRVTQTVQERRVRTDLENERQIPGRDEVRAIGEMRFARYLEHTMTLVDEALPLSLTEELLRNQIVERILPTVLPPDYLWASPALTLAAGGDPALAVSD